MAIFSSTQHLLPWSRSSALMGATCVFGLTLAGLLAGCGGSGGDQPVPTQINNTNNTQNTARRRGIRGRILAPNGTTPIEGALVYAPVNQTRAAASSRQAPPEPVIAQAVTDALGNFQIDAIPGGEVVIKVIKGQWRYQFIAPDAGGDVTEIPPALTILPSNPQSGGARIAVVLGSFDHMEDILAKLGMGTVDANGSLQRGTETFDLYPDPGPLFSDPARLAQYDIVFVNCGADESPLESDAAKNNIRNYVNAGGILYATDLAYDYVEQVFPDGADFLGSETTPPGQPEQPGDAERGQSGITSDAAVLEARLKNWLAARNLLNPDQTLHIQGFAGGWAVIDIAPPGTTVWVQGPVDFSRSRLAGTPHQHGSLSAPPSGRQEPVRPVKPLTITFPFGQGKVLYSSYHTVHGEGGDPLAMSPQEQVLSFLVFEL